jgi:hypothetical protein
MTFADATVARQPSLDILTGIRQKGVRLWIESGRLRYAAPKGVLTGDDLSKLRACRSELLMLLKAECGARDPGLLACAPSGLVPLTFSQLSRWQSLQAGDIPRVRSITSAMRLRGRLDLGALKASIGEIVTRHEALRSRIVVCDGVPMQASLAAADLDLQIEDLTELPANQRESQIERIAEKHVLTPVDLALDPLLSLRLLRLGSDEHVLIAAMEHIVSDGYSSNLFWRDLLTSYRQASQGCAFRLPTIAVQFAEYAIQQRAAESSWIETHLPYWRTRLAGYRRTAFPLEECEPAARRLGCAKIPLRISKELLAGLSAWARARGSTLVMSVFTAYAALVLRWCNATDCVIQYQTDGRDGPGLENTIGFFAAPLYLRIALRECDSFDDLLYRLMDEYCHAYENADHCYLAAQTPRPELARSPAFNWVPPGQQADMSCWSRSEGALDASHLPFGDPTLAKLELDNDPTVFLRATEDGVTGGLYFPRRRFAVETMERFARHFDLFMRALASRSSQRVMAVAIGQ